MSHIDYTKEWNEDDKRRHLSILAYCKSKMKTAKNGRERHRYKIMRRNIMRMIGGVGGVVELRLQGISGDIEIGECPKCKNFINVELEAENQRKYLYLIDSDIRKMNICWQCKKDLQNDRENERKFHEEAKIEREQHERNHTKRS